MSNLVRQHLAAVKTWENSIKQRFNRRWPYYRLCLKPWCLRIQSYDHRCWKHYGWEWPDT